MKVLLIVFGLSCILSVGCSKNGKLLSKDPIILSQTSLWENISYDDQLDNSLRHLNLLSFYNITYESDNQVVQGLVIEPKQKGKYPVVIFNRGGNRDFAELELGTLLLYTSALAAEGFVIIGSNLRDKDEFGGAEVNDVLHLMESVKALEKADPKRMGMFGWSRGGMMTYLALKKSDKIKTAIIGNGASDLFDTAEFRPEMEKNTFAECIPNYWENRDEELVKRSAIYWADELNKKSSLLILSGTKDKRVNPAQAEVMAERLKEINYNYTFKQYDTDHYFSDKKEELNQEVIRWFKEKL